jgi:indole-3-glycerol phosphate synthase
VLWSAEVPVDEAADAADAVLLVFDEDADVEALHARAVALGLDCAVEVRTEEDLEQALERIDPEIFLLSPAEGDDDESPLEVVLDLLAAVPAGKLAIADLPLVTPRESQELELAGCDAVIVATQDIAVLAGDLPPDV